MDENEAIRKAEFASFYSDWSKPEVCEARGGIETSGYSHQNDARCVCDDGLEMFRDVCEYCMVDVSVAKIGSLFPL